MTLPHPLVSATTPVGAGDDTGGDPGDRRRVPSVPIFIALVLLYLGVVALSASIGTPKALPGVALGWGLVFHLERAAAAVGTVGAVLWVMWQSAHDEWPSKLGIGSVEYSQAVDDTADALKSLREVTWIQEQRIRLLEARQSGTWTDPDTDDH